MTLTNRERELIAIGASVAANCQPCLRSHVEKAVNLGADAEEVAAAVQIGNSVRRGAAAKMDGFSSALLEEAPQSPVGAVMLEGESCHGAGR